MTRIADFRIDESTWKQGSVHRRAEWRVLLSELVAHGDFTAAMENRYLLATPTTETVLFEVLDDEGNVLRDDRLDLASLGASITEYAGIIRKLDGTGEHYDTAWFQAVDMAKKVVHDRAADILSRRIGALCTHEPTLRLVFSFLFALRVDTSRMSNTRHR